MNAERNSKSTFWHFFGKMFKKNTLNKQLDKQDILLAWKALRWSIALLSYKHSTIVNYDSRVIPDQKLPHITTLEL